MCNDKTLFALQSHQVDKMKGRNGDLRKTAIFPRCQSNMTAELAKEATPSGTLFDSCCGGPYASSCSGKICLFFLQLHLVLHCSFSCPAEGKAKLGDKQEMLSVDLGLLMSKAVRQQQLSSVVAALRLFARGCPTSGHPWGSPCLVLTSVLFGEQL